jgi:diguanylate cyclase (GGDEF)-like protein/PAS domain S-box-containing protein
LRLGRRQIVQAERRFLDGFESAPIGMAIVAPSGRVVHINAAFCELLGRDVEPTLERNALEFIVEEDRAHARDLFARAMDDPGEPIDGEVRVITPKGVRWTESHVTFLFGEGLLLIQVIDITQRREFEHRLVHQAEHDPLTELLNRRGFRRVVEAHMGERDHALQEPGAVLLLDLDHFKAVNDLRGHRAGDETLRRVAQVLGSSVRDGDTVARLGGDEFAILLPGAGVAQARATAGRLVAAIDQEGISASIGVAMIGPSMHTPDDALVAADLAMYDAKDAGRGRYKLVDERVATSSATRSRLEWVDRIRGALAEDRLVLHAQPIRNVHTDQVLHHELLLRLRDGDGTEVLPANFLEVAEQFGLIGEIDRWVTRTAIDILADHRDDDLTFHVNLSGSTVGDLDLLSTIRHALQRARVEPGRLVFEITETAAVTNIDRARTFALALTALGCQLALDDFGAGFGSFVYLKQLPFDILKIDGEFVRHCTTTPADRVILESLVHAAVGLGKVTVAEFVEDQPTEDLLRRLGVDYVQGYHVGRPVAVQTAIEAARVGRS